MFKMHKSNSRSSGNGWDAVVAVVAVLSANYLAIFSMPQFDLSVRLVAYGCSSIFWMVFLRSKAFAPVSKLLSQLWRGLPVMLQMLTLVAFAFGIYIHHITRIIFVGLLSYRGIIMLLGEEDIEVRVAVESGGDEAGKEYVIPTVQLTDIPAVQTMAVESHIHHRLESDVLSPQVERRKVAPSSSRSKPVDNPSFQEGETSYRSPGLNLRESVADNLNKSEVASEPQISRRSDDNQTQSKPDDLTPSESGSAMAEESSEDEEDQDSVSELEEVMDIDYSTLRKKRRIISSASSYISETSSDLDYSESKRKKRMFDSSSELLLAYSSKRISLGQGNRLNGGKKMLLITASPANKENDSKRLNLSRPILKTGRPVLKRKTIDKQEWTAEEDATFHAYLKEEIEDRQSKRSKPSEKEKHSDTLGIDSSKSVSFSFSATSSTPSLTVSTTATTPSFTFGNSEAATNPVETDSAKQSEPASVTSDITLKLPLTPAFTFASLPAPVSAAPPAPASAPSGLFGQPSATDDKISFPKDVSEKINAEPSTTKVSFTFGAPTSSNIPTVENKSQISSTVEFEKPSNVVTSLELESKGVTSLAPAFTFGATSTPITSAASSTQLQDKVPPVAASSFTFSLPPAASGKPPTTPTSTASKQTEVPFGIAFSSKDSNSGNAAPSTTSLFVFGSSNEAVKVEKQEIASSTVAAATASSNPFSSAFSAPAPVAFGATAPVSSAAALPSAPSTSSSTNPFSNAFAAPSASPAFGTIPSSTFSTGSANPFSNSFATSTVTLAPPAATIPTTSFGQSAAPASASSSNLTTTLSSNPFSASFGANTFNSNPAPSNSGTFAAPQSSTFGNTSAGATPVFGQPAAASNSASMFGSTTSSSAPNPFAQSSVSAPFSTAGANNNPFGATTLPSLQSNVFGAAGSTTSTGMFGTSTAAPSMFPSNTQAATANPFASSSTFGAPSSQPAFGSSMGGMGGNAFGASTASSGFGGAAPANPFGNSGAPSNSFGASSGFGAPASMDSFNVNPPGSAFGGSQPAFGIGSSNNNNNRRKTRIPARK